MAGSNNEKTHLSDKLSADMGSEREKERKRERERESVGERMLMATGKDLDLSPY